MKREIEEIEYDIRDCINQQKALSARRDILEKERLAFLRGTQFYCPDCGRKSTLSKWVFIQASQWVAGETAHPERGDWHYRTPDKCGIRHKCGGIFHIPKLAHNERLLEIMNKVGIFESPKLFGSIEDLEEKDLLMLCKR